MTGIIYPELVEIVKVDCQKHQATIKVRMLELRVSGGGLIEAAEKPAGKEQDREEAKVDRYDPTMFENPEMVMGGYGGESTVTVSLDSILTRDEKKAKALMQRIWRHGDIAEFTARYHAKDLDDALDWFYRKVLIKLRMITPTSFTSSKLEYLKPVYQTILALVEKEKQQERRAKAKQDAKEINAIINEKNPSAAGGLRQELTAT